jgi:hypothetical protein
MSSQQHSQTIFADNGVLVASDGGTDAVLEVSPITTATPAGRPRLYLASYRTEQPGRVIAIEPARRAAKVAARAQDRARAAARHPAKKIITTGHADAVGNLLHFPKSTAAPAAALTSARASGEHCQTCTAPPEHDQWNVAARGETSTQRLDRAYAEILQEVRIAQTGVRILLAMLGAALLLIFDVVLGMHPGMFLTAGTLTWFATLWFFLPVWPRIRHGRRGQQSATFGT